MRLWLCKLCVSGFANCATHTHTHTTTVLALRGSYLASIVIPLEIAKAGRQVPKSRCLSPAAHSLDIRIAGSQVPKPRCLSPAAHSLDVRITGRQVSDLHGMSKQLYLARIAWISGLLVVRCISLGA